MSQGTFRRSIGPADGQLVDLVEAALVDPALSTDLRMRIAHEIEGLLRDAHGRPAVTAPGAGGPPAPHREELPALLRGVLVDPNLHTDMRMRLHREISEILQSARGA